MNLLAPVTDGETDWTGLTVVWIT